MSATHPLTDRQQQIFDLIQNTIAQTGSPPTRAEISERLGFRSVNAAEEHLQALARKGVIELLSGTARGIRLKADALQSIRALRGLPDAQMPTGLMLPLIGRVAAGSPILAQEHIDRMYCIDHSLFPCRPDYLLRVCGMSMRDAGIIDGDLLAVQTTHDVQDGQIVVARLGDDVMVRRWTRLADSVELRPENPDFSTIMVTPDQPFEVEGLVVGLIRHTVPMQTGQGG